MANHLLMNNLITDDLTITHVADVTSITETTSKTKLLNGQLEDAYLFQTTSGDSSTITISNIRTSANGNYIGAISIQNWEYPYINIQSVTAYKGATSYTTTELCRVQDATGIDTDSRIMQQITFALDNGNTGQIDKIEIYMTTTASAGHDFKLGHVYAGELFDVSISPNKATYSAQVLNSSDFSRGGQKYYSTPIVLKTAKHNITHITDTNTNLIYQASLNHGTTKPLILLDSSGYGKYRNIYGTYQSFPTFQTIESLEDVGKWYTTANIDMIENR